MMCTTAVTLKFILWFILVFLAPLETDARATNTDDQKPLWEVTVLSHSS